VLQTPSDCTSGNSAGTAITTTASGGWVCRFAVPSEAAGPYHLVGVDVTSSTPSPAQVFTVTLPQITVTPTQGPPGTNVTVLGTGFSVSSTILSLMFGSSPITNCAEGSLTTNPSGSFNCTFPLPIGATGSTFTATDDGGQTASYEFSETHPATAPSSSLWLWILLAAVVAVAAVLAVVVVGRRRPTSRAAPSARRQTPEAEPELDQAFEPAGRPGDGPAIDSSPLTTAAPVSTSPPPAPPRLSSAEELAAALGSVPMPKPTLGLDAVPPSAPVVFELPPESPPPTPAAPLPEPLVEPEASSGTEMTSAPADVRPEWKEPTPEAPTPAPDNQLDFDSVMAELDALSGQILRPTPKKGPGPTTPDVDPGDASAPPSG
jgi:hypothetical protein